MEPFCQRNEQSRPAGRTRRSEELLHTNWGLRSEELALQSEMLAKHVEEGGVGYAYLVLGDVQVEGPVLELGLDVAQVRSVGEANGAAREHGGALGAVILDTLSSPIITPSVLLQVTIRARAHR